jgi:hypothetical protein
MEFERILEEYWAIAWFISILYCVLPFYILNIHTRLGKLMKLMDSRNENLYIRTKNGECKHCQKEKKKKHVLCSYCYKDLYIDFVKE